MSKKILVLIGLLGMTATLLCGCWDSTEVNNRSIILELAVDKNDDFEYDETKLIDDQDIYTVSYTIPDFGKLSGTNTLATDVENTIEVQAPTLGSSVDDLEIKNKNSVSFGHVKALLFGESLLKDPELFKRAMDGLSRDMLIARNVPLLAVNGEAKLASQIENAEQPILGLYIMDYFNNGERATSFFKKQLVGTYIKEMDDTGVSTLPLFHVEDIEQNTGDINISGAAVIQNYELVGYLTKEEVRSQLFVEGKIESSPVVVPYSNTLLTYNVKREKSKLKFGDTPEGPWCLIEIEAEGSISEYLSTGDDKLIDHQTIEEVKVLIAEEIVKQVELGIVKSKEMNVDFLGIGEAFYRQKPALWMKYQPTWLATTYQKMPISIGVNVAIQSTGLED
ncbi:MAG: Ger(x)C family spore germination protein [Niameybacter sp.]|uniref:Ger(x)C family spore germination protein n=1 Tax=Niameybacter sp. TaxID=2033640 RepID=UPI002FC778FD